MITALLILNAALLFFVLDLRLRTKKFRKELDEIGRWCAYLETTIKDAQIIVFNQAKGEKGKYEVNRKLIDLLEKKNV